MTGNPAFLAADWGTSSFRLWLVDARGGVLADRRSDEGMQAVAPDRFAGVLAGHVAALGPLVDALPRPLPVVLCGMAGARQGWHEAPYVDLPCVPGAVVDAAIRVPASEFDARILPGIARRDPRRPDVMRGEETKLLGLLLDEPGKTGIVCMPGTHPKWVRLDAGTVADFATSMTGELFALLSGQSILRHAIGGQAPSGRPDAPAFAAGLAEGLADPGRVATALFSLRARGLLSGAGGEEIADRLSGLLIGAEVGSQLAGLGSPPVTLVASGRQADLYTRAIEATGAAVRLVDAERAVRGGLMQAARVFWSDRFERLPA